MIGPELAGQAMVVIVGKIRRPVAREMGPGIRTAGLVLRSSAVVVTTVVVRTLHQHRGQDIKQN